MNPEDELVDKVRGFQSGGPYGKALTLAASAKPVRKAGADRKEAWRNIITLHLAVVFLLSIALVADVKAQQSERPDFGGGSLFSYVPPKGWKVLEFPGFKFKISRGEPVKGFAPNILVVDEEYSKSLDDYAKDNVATIQKLFQGLTVIDQTDFTTSDGARAIKLVTERHDDIAKKRLRQVYYFYDAGNKKLVATCSSLAEEGPASDLVFDTAMKTFSFKPGPH